MLCPRGWGRGFCRGLAAQQSPFPVFLSVALHRGPPGSRGPMIPPLLSLPPPPRGRGPLRGGLGPRASPYGRGWWGVNTEPPFPGPGHGGPSRESFYKEPRNPRRLKSWSLVKNTCPPPDIPPVMEGKAHLVMPVPCPACQHAPSGLFSFGLSLRALRINAWLFPS